MKRKKEENKKVFSLKEFEIFKKLNTPTKIQDFISNLDINFEEDGKDTCMSPLSVMNKKKCHCIEGAFLAAAILKFYGYKPLVVDMVGEKGDWDHVIAVFQEKGKWGAISKTNHSVLRFRDPIYRDIRELVMSYFNEYTDDKGKGKKTLRKFSNPVNLDIFGEDWITSKDNLWHIHDYLDSVKHFNILNKKQLKELRKQEQIEIQAGQMIQFKQPVKKI